jgi:hypothetical protein
VCVGVIDLLQIRSMFQAFLLTTAVVFAGFIVCSHTLNLSVPKRCVDVKTLTVAATRDCQEPARPGAGATEARFAWYWGGSNSGQGLPRLDGGQAEQVTRLIRRPRRLRPPRSQLRGPRGTLGERKAVSG